MRTKVAKGGSPSVAVAYLRASKEEQKLTPEAQRAAIEACGVREGFTVVSWHLDNLTSVTEMGDRIALPEAFRAILEHKAGVLAVAKRDRIARDPVITGLITREVNRLGAQLVSAGGEGNGDTPADAMMRGIVDVFAAYERSLIQARTKAALAVLKSRGLRTGGALPYGFRLADDGRTLLPEPGEQATIEQVRMLRSSGLSFRAISQQLAECGRVSRKGTPFQTPQLLRMLEAS